MLVQDQLESILKTEAVIPVWDAGNLQVTREIPRFHQLRDHLRAHRKGGLSPDPAANLIGEVFFSDSAHSPMIQMADLASYLLLSRDKVECGWQPSDWINRLLKIVPEIPSEILTETRGRLTISGTTRGIVPFTE
jgi:hypothetical protein